MRKSILVILALALLAGGASAKLGDLVASFGNVGSSTHYGLAADANYLYSFYYNATYRYPILRMRKSNGAFVSSYPAPGPTSPQYTRGICYDGTGYIYGNNYSRDYVTRFRASDGSLLSTWTYAKADARYGLCVDHNGTSAGNYIYQSDLDGDFWKSTLTGTLVSSWSMHIYNYVYDQAWDYNNKLIWCADYSTDWIYAIDPNTHKTTYSFRHPKWATILNCYGIAYWGDYLYVSNSGGTPDEYIWVFHCPHYLGVKPASLGKVKALFK